jgi:hypothetical protein
VGTSTPLGLGSLAAEPRVQAERPSVAELSLSNRTHTQRAVRKIGVDCTHGCLV